MWQPEGYKNPHQYTIGQPLTKMLNEAFEAGAAVMLEALWALGAPAMVGEYATVASVVKLRDIKVRNPVGTYGKLVFIPNEEEQDVANKGC